MTYETIDWEAEAKRVAKAFGIKGECVWIDVRKQAVQLVALDDLVCKYGIPISEDAYAVVQYSKGSRFFQIFDGSPDVGIFINWQGAVWESDVIAHGDTLAKALYHLSLLTPEVEQALGVTIDAHTKLEWELEFAGRDGG